MPSWTDRLDWSVSARTVLTPAVARQSLEEGLAPRSTAVASALTLQEFVQRLRHLPEKVSVSRILGRDRFNAECPSAQPRGSAYLRPQFRAFLRPCLPEPIVYFSQCILSGLPAEPLGISVAHPRVGPFMPHIFNRSTHGLTWLRCHVITISPAALSYHLPSEGRGHRFESCRARH
jgi:hypothetical protein